MAAADATCRQGLLAFGDSITHGGGLFQRRIATQSWALWTARGLGLPYTGYAVDAARLAAVLEEQIPAWRARTPRPDARYDLGCLYAGVNDARLADFDPAAFGRRYDEALQVLAGHCDALLALTLPLDLGRPRAPEAVEAANRAIEAAAARNGALVADLRGFGGREHVTADHIHPTAFGQIDIAERALDVLSAAGFDVRVRPTSLVAPATAGPWVSLRFDARYAAEHARVSARAAVKRLVGRSGT